VASSVRLVFSAFVPVMRILRALCRAEWRPWDTAGNRGALRTGPFAGREAFDDGGLAHPAVQRELLATQRLMRPALSTT
jgi:hypothetical protein